jgi:Fn3 associated
LIDPYQAQEDFYQALLSAGQFNTVNIVNERKFIMQSELEIDAIWSTVRNGRAGNGILVEEILVDSKYPGANAPIFEITFPIVCFQNGDAALLPNAGGGFYAQRLAFMVMDLFYQWSVEGAMTLLDGRSYERAKDYPFINAIRVLPKLGIKASALTARAGFITATNVGQMVTLSCATPGATIVYTLDGSFPALPAAMDPISGAAVNPNALVYNAPFNLPVGQMVRAIAYANGLNMGPLLKFCITN